MSSAQLRVAFFVVEEMIELKSPILSPYLEKGRGSLDFPLIVRDAPDEIPLPALASKPSLNPDSRNSPRIHARQQMTSGEGGSKRLDLATQESPWRSCPTIL